MSVLVYLSGIEALKGRLLPCFSLSVMGFDQTDISKSNIGMSLDVFEGQLRAKLVHETCQYRHEGKKCHTDQCDIQVKVFKSLPF